MNIKIDMHNERRLRARKFDLDYEIEYAIEKSQKEQKPHVTIDHAGDVPNNYGYPAGHGRRGYRCVP